MKWFWGCFAAGVGLVSLFFLLVSMGWLGYMPPLEELENPQNRNASEVYSADNKQIGRFYKTANRTTVEYSELSQHLVDALVATEDARFYDHMGVDLKALSRVVLKMGKAGGGSTITQQLAKQLWSAPSHSTVERAMQKFNEWIIAIKLERMYSKDQIVMMYFNQFDFLYNAVGIESASQVYYGKKPSQLSIDEAAMLVGMCKNPSYYNPIRHPERAKERRNVVLAQMLKYGYLTQAECAELQAKELACTLHRDEREEINPAPYFTDHIRQMMMADEPHEKDYPDWNKAQYQIDKWYWDHDPLYGWCNKNHKQNGDPYNVYTDGLRIYSTLDTRMQAHAEAACLQHMTTLQSYFWAEKRGHANAPFSDQITADEREAILRRSMRQTDRYRMRKAAGMSEEEIFATFREPSRMRVFAYNSAMAKDTTMTPLDSIIYTKHFLRCGFMAMDPSTGYVKAYVGGVNHDFFQYDMAAVGRRQIGSTVKPYLFAYGMTEDMWPCEKIALHRQDVTFTTASGAKWTPRDGHGGGAMSLAHALAISSNWMSAYFMALYGPEPIVKLMKAFGLKNIKAEINGEPNYPLCMGSCEVSVEEMVNAYTTFCNKGIRVSPTYVTRIEDAQGNVIANFMQQTTEVMSDLSAKKMIYMMRKVCTEGTGKRMPKYTHVQIAGKTGTTQNNSDGWFVGYTPSLVSGAWVGGEDRSIHFQYTGIGQGASMALPIVGIFNERVYRDPALGYDYNETFDMGEFDPNEGCHELAENTAM